MSFEIPDGHYGLLVGKSGCGKTTVLEAICGLRETSGGSIFLGDEEITSLKPGERGVGYVPQDGALFPTLSPRKQLAFALQLRKVETSRIVERIEELAERLGDHPKKNEELVVNSNYHGPCRATSGSA